MNRRSWLPEDVRAHNRGLLLRLLTDHGPLSRRELADRTGLSIPTVTSIITDLSCAGYVTEAVPPAPPARRGPRATVITLSHSRYTALGVQIGADTVRIGRSDLSGLVSDATEVPVPPGTAPDRVIGLAVAAAAPVVAAARGTLVAIGVGIPGPVDATGRRCVLSLGLGWRDVDVTTAFEDAFGLPAVAEYNVRAMATAEARHGLGQRAENLLFVHVGDGVGFGFVVDGRPFRQGAHGVSELGHQQVAADGPACVCGSVGCLEAVLCEPQLRVRVAEAARHSEAIAAAQPCHRAPLDVLDAAAETGDPLAVRLLDEFAEHVGTAVALNVNVFSPTRVALGGILASAPKEVLVRVLAATRTRVCSVLRQQVSVEPSAIGPHAEVLGAATIALDQVFYDQGAMAYARPC